MTQPTLYYFLYQLINTHDATLLLVREFPSREAARLWIGEKGEAGKKYTILEVFKT